LPAPACRRGPADAALSRIGRRARLLQAELNHQRKDSVALIQADLLDLGKLQSLIDQTVQTFGKLDALINNASSFFPDPVGEITGENWDDLIGTNLRAPLFIAQARRRAEEDARRDRPTSPTSTPSAR
jgi:pteridine reductase